MGWTNITGTQGQLTRNIPPSGCFTAVYVNWKSQFQGTAAIERWVEGSSARSVGSAQMTVDPTGRTDEGLQLQLNAAITDDLQAGFQLDQRRGAAFLESVRGGGASPRAFANALLNCLSIKQKLNIAGTEVTIGVAADTDLCFFSFQVPLAQYRPEFPQFELGGSRVRVRANLQGTATFKFGLSRAGWAWVGQRVAPSVLRPLLQRLGQLVGQQAARALAVMTGVTFISVVGGVVGGVALAALTAHFVESARASGRRMAHCGQYALGYVMTAWMPLGSGFEAEEAALNRASGPSREGHTGDEIRLIGVSEALQDIENNGGGLDGAHTVRRELLSLLEITDLNPRRQLSVPQRDRVVAALAGRLEARG